MGKLGRWKEQMVSALEIPPDLAYSETIISPVSSGKGKHLWKKSGDSLVYFQRNEGDWEYLRYLSKEADDIKIRWWEWKKS